MCPPRDHEVFSFLANLEEVEKAKEEYEKKLSEYLRVGCKVHVVDRYPNPASLRPYQSSNDDNFRGTGAFFRGGIRPAYKARRRRTSSII